MSSSPDAATLSEVHMAQIKDLRLWIFYTDFPQTPLGRLQNNVTSKSSLSFSVLCSVDRITSYPESSLALSVGELSL